MTSRLPRQIALIPLILLMFSACPAMVNAPVGAPGSPLGAGGSEKTTSDKTSDSSPDSSDSPGDTTSPPAAAAPLPPPGGGGDPAGTTAPPMEPAFRRIEGGIGGETPMPVSGPLATREGGVLGAPSSREAIDTPDDNLRILFWPASVRRNWTNAEDFFAKLASGNISEETAKQAKALHAVAMICPPCPTIDADSPTVRSEEEIPSKDYFAKEAGYYLFFITEDGGLWDMGSESMDVTSTAHLKGLVRLDQADPDGHEFRLKFLGERTIFAMPMIDPRFLRRPLPGNVAPEILLRLLEPVQP